MPNVVIPEPHLLTFIDILNLSDDEINNVEKVFADLDNIAKPSLAEEALSAVLPLDSGDLYERIPSVLLSAASTITKSSFSEDEILDDVIEGIKSHGYAGDDSRAYDVIGRLIGPNSTIVVGLSAIDTYISHDRPVLSFRILTDIRPIFSGSGQEMQISKMTIYHNLEITTLKDGFKDKSYFALDSGDLYKIQRVVERAIIKERLLTEKVAQGIEISRISRGFEREER